MTSYPRVLAEYLPNHDKAHHSVIKLISRKCSPLEYGGVEALPEILLKSNISGAWKNNMNLHIFQVGKTDMAIA